MTLTYTYDGAAMTHNVAPTSLALGSRADRGNVEEGGLTIEDPSGNLTLTGLRPFYVEESDCSQPRLYTGYVAGREIGRSYSATQILGASARVHEATLYDLNAAFMFRMITGADGKRPEETWDARLAWLVASDYLAPFITGTTHSLSMTRNMEATDYRYRYPMDVCNDLLDRTGDVANYFLYWDPSANAGVGGVSLFFNRTDATTYQSTIKISNVDGDPNGSTVFAPSAEAKLRRDPDTVYSGVVVEYADGQRVFTSRTDTATTYIQRETSISRPYTGRSTTATSQGQGWLQAHAAEVDRITCTIRVPRSAVGLVTAGCAMEVKFSHLPGYSSYTWVRVAFCDPKPIDDYARVYDVSLELVAQRAGSSSSGVGCNTPGAWSGSFAVGKTVTDVYSAGVSAPTGSAGYTDGNIDEDPALYGAAVFSAGTPYYRGWRVDLGAEYEISSITHVGRVAGIDDATYAASGELQFRGGTSVAGIAAVAGTITAPDMNGWDTGLGSHAVGYTLTLTTPTTLRYLEVWDAWTAAGSGFRGGFYGYQLLVGGCSVGTATVAVDLTGSTVTGETVNEAPDGTVTVFTVDNAYIGGSLTVTVDNLDQTAAVTESDPTTGEFTLAFAPTAGELVRATYRVG